MNRQGNPALATAPGVTLQRTDEHAWPRALGWIYGLELFAIWCAGSTAAWGATDAMLRSASVVGGIALAIAGWSLSGTRVVAWRGTLFFAASWMVFPLFKAIRQTWISRVHDSGLLTIDRALWGGVSLPEHAFALERPWLSELLSGGYFCFYFVVLVPVICFTFRRHTRDALWFFFGLNLTYMLGFAGYLLVPAGGPYMAFPAQFPYPVHGGPVTAFLTDLVAQGITGMDVFPSLHSGVSIYVLGFCVLAGYRRAALVLAPVVASIVVATVYLRYHYGIDLFAGMLLASGVLWGVSTLRKGNR